jgi:hypothetical protein
MKRRELERALQIVAALVWEDFPSHRLSELADIYLMTTPSDVAVVRRVEERLGLWPESFVRGDDDAL